MKSLAKLIVVALVLAGGAWLYRHFAAPAADTAKKDNPPVPVLVAKAESRDLAVAVDLVGRGEAYESVSLRSRVDGQVQSVSFQEGQQVKAGEVLLRLDPADFDARLKQAEANLARDQAQLQKARADVGRYQALFQQGFVSAEKIADLRAAEAAAEASVQATRAAVELARLQRAYATVRAPIAGSIGARLVFPGTAVKTNDTELAVINRVQPLLVGFALPESHIEQMRAAMAKAPLAASIGAPGGETRQATVSFVDNAVDPGTGTLRLKARLENDDGRFAPGQYLRVELRLDTLKDAVTVPVEAVQQGSKGRVVYVVTPDNGIDIRPVSIAAERDGLAAIGQGVQAGETVVTDGHLRLTPKSKVTIKLPETKPAKG